MFSSATPSTQIIDNQNSSTIQYSANWGNDTLQGVPSTASSAPFSLTNVKNTSFSVNFTGRAVALYGPTTFDHGRYSVVRHGFGASHRAESDHAAGAGRNDSNLQCNDRLAAWKHAFVLPGRPQPGRKSFIDGGQCRQRICVELCADHAI